MRLATFNVLHGLAPLSGTVDRDQFAETIRSLDADVLGVQEVDRGQPRSGGLDLAALAAEASGASAWRFASALIGTPGADWREATDEDDDVVPAYGITLASRYPVESWHVIRLGRARVRIPIYVPGWRPPTLFKDEPRMALAAVVATPLGRMTIATAHLSITPAFNALQLVRLKRVLQELPRPRVLMGDLNLPGGWPVRLTRWQPLAQVRTFPSPRPRVQIDHMLLDGELPPVVSVEAPQLAISDHRPLVVTLDASRLG